MKPAGVNMINVKQINRKSVLQLLLRSGPLSRTDLAAELNLTTATLTSICSDFLQKKLLLTSNKSRTQTLGRQKCPLEINPSYKYVLAISLHYTGHVIAITNLLGDPVAVTEFSLPRPYTAVAFLKELANTCVRLLWENNIPCEKVLGAGVGMIGSVNQDKGISLHPFKVFEEDQVPIRDILQAEFPFPVFVENNMCAYLNAEYLFGSAQASNVLAIKWGPGVGSASSIDGQICKDHLYHSAEVGHTYFYTSSNRLCKCGRKGCLETGVNLDRFVEAIQSLLPSQPALQAVQQKSGDPCFENIETYIGTGCTALTEQIRPLIHDFAIGVSNAIQVFSPDQVLLFGVLFESPNIAETFLNDILQINPLLSRKLFCKSALGWKKEYLGPAATAINIFLVETGGNLPE